MKRRIWAEKLKTFTEFYLFFAGVGLLLYTGLFWFGLRQEVESAESTQMEIRGLFYSALMIVGSFVLKKMDFRPSESRWPLGRLFALVCCLFSFAATSWLTLKLLDTLDPFDLKVRHGFAKMGFYFSMSLGVFCSLLTPPETPETPETSQSAESPNDDEPRTPVAH